MLSNLVDLPPVIGNRYEIHKELGSGGMGTVYQAGDLLTNELVALKQVSLSNGSPENTEDAQNDRLALTREFKVLASLRHPNIISVLDYGFFGEDKRPYFVMEMLHGARTIIDAGKERSVRYKLKLLAQTLQALIYLHRRGVVHRDLKPDNILVVGDKVKVLDFGLARTDRDYQEVDADSERVSGTLAYMAPELLRGDDATVSSDLYAFGLISYELLSGFFPFPMNDITQLIYSIQTEIPDVSKIDVKIQLSMVLHRLLSKTPAERHGSAREVLKAFDEATDFKIEHENVATRESFLQAAEFVGREGEIELLKIGTAQAVKHKQGSSWLVGGESGIGKSRFVEEIRVHALVEGMTVVRGQSTQENNSSYQLWRDVLRRLVLGAGLSDEDAAILLTALPGIDHLPAMKARQLPDVDLNNLHVEMKRILRNLLEQQRNPILILLEDLQWASENSLSLLESVLPVLGGLPVMIIANYRDDEAPELAERLGAMRQIKLRRLNNAEIQRLSVSMLGKFGKRSNVVDLLTKETEGNVFFVVEVVRALAEQAGTLDDIGSITLPVSVFAGGVREIVQQRLNRLPDDALQKLKAAAVIGRELDLPLLQAVLGSEDLATWLTVCADASVLEVSENKWRFSHDKLREGILEKLFEQESILLHRQTAVTMETLYDKLEDYSPVLAFHWGAAQNPVKERHYLEVAGENAFKVSSFQEAIKFFEQAVALIEASEKTDDIWRELSNLHAKLSECYRSLGKLDRATRHIEDSLKIGEQISDRQIIADAQRWLGMLDSRSADYESAKQRLNVSLMLSTELHDETGIATTLYTLGCIDLYEERYDAAKDTLDSCLKLRQKLKDDWGAGRVYNALGEVAMAEKDYMLAEEYYSRAVMIYEDLEDQFWYSASLNNMGHSSARRGAYDLSLSYFWQALEIASKINILPIISEILAGIAIPLSQRWDYGRASMLLGYVTHHPQVEQEVLTKVAFARSLIEPHLSPDDFKEKFEQGKKLKLDDIIEIILNDRD